MKNLKSKFIVFLSALIVFISVPSVPTYADFDSSIGSVRFYVSTYVYYLDEYIQAHYPDYEITWNNGFFEYSSTPYITVNVLGFNYSSHYRHALTFVTDYYYVIGRDTPSPYVKFNYVEYWAGVSYLSYSSPSGNGYLNDGHAYVFEYGIPDSLSVSTKRYSSMFEWYIQGTQSGYLDLNSLDYVSLTYSDNNRSLIYYMDHFISSFNSTPPTVTSTPDPDTTPDPDNSSTPTPEPTYFPFVTPAPENIYQPVDSPIGDVGSSYGYSSSTGQNSGSSGNYQPTFSNSHLNISLYLNSEFISTQTVDVGSYLEPPVSSLGILSLYGATYYKYGDNIYVNLGDNVYQFLEWKFYLRNGTTPNNTFGSLSYMPISTSLTGSRFYIAPVYETFYYDSFTGQKKFISQPNFDSSYYATLTVDIKLVLVEGEIYDPPSNPSGSDYPYINPNYKPLIPPQDPTLNNPSSPPLSDGSSSLSNNTTGQGFDINHYLNFQFPTVLAYLGFLFTQSFNFLADNSVIVFSAIVVIVVASIFLIIRERL